MAMEYFNVIKTTNNSSNCKNNKNKNKNKNKNENRTTATTAAAAAATTTTAITTKTTTTTTTTTTLTRCSAQSRECYLEYGNHESEGDPITVSHPVRRGVLRDIDEMEKIMDNLFNFELAAYNGAHTPVRLLFFGIWREERTQNIPLGMPHTMHIIIVCLPSDNEQHKLQRLITYRVPRVSHSLIRANPTPRR